MKNLVLISVCSKWHVKGAESYLLANPLEGSCEYHIFLVKHAPTGSYRVSKEDFKYLKEKPEVYFYNLDDSTNQQEIMEGIKKNFEKIDYSLLVLCSKQMNMRQILSTRDAKIRRYVVLDEGMGTYYSSKLWNLELNELNNTQGSTKTINISDIVKSLIQKVICRNLSEFKLLKSVGGRWLVNEKVARAYGTYLKNIENISIDTQVQDQDLVFVSDNLGLMLDDKSREVEIYKLILERIKRDFSPRTIYFKPHPNEKSSDKIKKIEGLGYELLLENTAFEDIMYSRNILGCGFASTALLTSALIMEKEVFTFIDFIPEDAFNEYGRTKKLEYKKIIEGIPKISEVKIEE